MTKLNSDAVFYLWVFHVHVHVQYHSHDYVFRQFVVEGIQFWGIWLEFSFSLAPVPYKHGSTRQSRKVPGPAGSRSGIIRVDFGVVERRRLSNERHAGAKWPLHGINTAPTRMTTDGPEQLRQSDGPTRTNTAETRTATNEHGPTRRVHGPSWSYTAVTRTNTDRSGQSKISIKAVWYSLIPSFCDRIADVSHLWKSRNASQKETSCQSGPLSGQKVVTRSIRCRRSSRTRPTRRNKIAIQIAITFTSTSISTTHSQCCEDKEVPGPVRRTRDGVGRLAKGESYAVHEDHEGIQRHGKEDTTLEFKASRAWCGVRVCAQSGSVLHGGYTDHPGCCHLPGT